MDKSYHSREGLHLRSAAENKSVATTSSSSPDFVLQWGNRKRLRCMKFSKSDRSNKTDSPGSDTPVQLTNRVDRRVVRSDQNKDSNTVTNTVANNSNNGGNGYFNLRQRAASPSSRLLRNPETMRGQSNGGVKGLASPERGVTGPDKRANNNNDHNNNNNNNVKCNKNSNINNDNNNNNNRSPSSETTNDGKKGGSPSGSDAIPAVWHPKFAISLTNKEKEEDFLVLKGSKLPQRPKKRNKFIQRNVNLISPGAWLCDLSLERYEVREKKVTKKRPRGLKAMGNVESDSEE